MNYHKGSVAPYFLLAFIALLFIGGGLAYFKSVNTDEYSLGGPGGLIETEPNTGATSSAQTTKSQAVNLETYTNDTFRFEVQYPNNWKVGSCFTSGQTGYVRFGLTSEAWDPSCDGEETSFDFPRIAITINPIPPTYVNGLKTNDPKKTAISNAKFLLKNVTESELVIDGLSATLIKGQKQWSEEGILPPSGGTGGTMILNGKAITAKTIDVQTLIVFSGTYYYGIKYSALENSGFINVFDDMIHTVRFFK